MRLLLGKINIWEVVFWFRDKYKGVVALRQTYLGLWLRERYIGVVAVRQIFGGCGCDINILRLWLRDRDMGVVA